MSDCLPSTLLSLTVTSKTRKSQTPPTTCNNNNNRKYFNSNITCNRTRKPTKLVTFSSNQHHQFYNQLYNNNNKNPLQEEEEEEEEPLLFKGSTPLSSIELKERKANEDEEDLVRVKTEKRVSDVEKRRRGRQVVKRWNLMAKQVIAIDSALSLGFVSQLWVDTTSWVVMGVEVRPNLLSAAESDTFRLEDVIQVGEVVLVESEDVLANALQMVGLETLVGYKVVTPGRQGIGKVRGYAFNINSGVVEFLELDSFGISIIPSSLVSTYALLVEDVLEVLPDTVVVREAAASRIQRLTKGLWDAKTMGPWSNVNEEYSEVQSSGGSKAGSRKTRKGFGKKKKYNDDYWELPMDYL